MIKKILLLSSLFFLASCYTIHFSKKSSVPVSYQTSQWYHIGLHGLLEFSDPVNLEKICPKNSWSSVRVRTGFLQGLVRFISIPYGTETVEYAGLALSWPTFLGVFYSPEEVSVSCNR